MSAISIVEVESNSEGIAIVEVRQGPVGPQGPPTGDLPRGQISIIDNVTATSIATINTYVEAGIVGTLDPDTDIDFTALNTGKFGVRYTGATTKTFWVSATAEITDGNNKIFGMRLAKNGTSILASESHGHTGSSGAEATMMTTWMISLATNQELSLVFANLSGTESLTIKRARLVINCIP